MKNSPLTPFQEKFCLLYHESGNALKSYREAYNCDNNTAKKGAYRIVRNPKVIKRLRQLQKAARKKHKIVTEDLIRVNAEVAFSKLSEVVRITPDGRIELKYDPNDPENIDQLDAISFSRSVSSSSSDKGDSHSESTSISVKKPDRVKAAQELARLLGSYENISDDKDDKKNAAIKLLESLAKFKKKDDE